MKTKFGGLAFLLVFLCTGALIRADTFTAQGASQVKDAFTYQGMPAYNYGGDNRVIIGKHTSDKFRWFMSFDIPSGTNTVTGPCSLAVYFISFAENSDTFDVYWNTRPNLKNYVGDNSGADADSAEMSWGNFFEGASGPDSAWTTPGGDFTSAYRLGSLIFTGGGSAGWRYWVLDSIHVDSLLKGTRANVGIWVVGRSTASLYTRCDGYSTENASYKPWIKFIYTSWSQGTPELPNRRRLTIIDRNE